MFRRIASFLRKRQVEQQLDDELDASLEVLVMEHIARGVPPHEAGRLARIELGGVEQVKEEIRAVRGLPMLDSVIRDFQHALKNLIRTPGVSIAVVVTLGLALGANASVISLLDRLILRPLPVKQPGSLVIVNAPRLPERPTGSRPRMVLVMEGAGGAAGLSYPLYAALVSRVHVFNGMLAQAHVGATMLVEATPVAVEGRLVTGNYFELLGVKASLGRLLTLADEQQAGGSPVVLSYGFWQRQFGGAPAILNRTIHLNRWPMTVVGVAAKGFTGTTAGAAPDFFTPLRMGGVLSNLPDASFRFDSPDLHVYGAMARLAPGTGLKQAEQAADQVYQQLVAQALGPGPGAAQAGRDYDKRRSEFRLRLSPGGYAASEQSSLSGELRTPLVLLMAMVGLVLAIAAGNVANLFLARGEARTREFAIRLALGASRWRLLRALLAEVLLLTLTAGGVGLLLASWTTGVAPAVLNLERLPDGVTPAPDLRIGVAVMVLSLGAGVCIWAASAPRAVGRATLTDLAARVQPGTRLTLRWRRVLLVAQAALSMVLLCGSAVLSHSLIRLMSVDPGFPVDNLYSFWLNPGRTGYDAGRSSAVLAQVFQVLGGIPGVKSVSVATDLPLSGRGMGTSVNRDQTSDEDAGVPVDTDIGHVSAGHLANLGIPIVAGREFSRDDVHGAKVVVISEALAQRLFGKNDPVGRRIGIDGGRPEWRVVGIVKDIKAGPRVPAKLILYQPYNVQAGVSSAAFALRVEKGLRLTRETVQATVRRVETAVAVEEFVSMRAQAARALYRDRMLAWVSVSFAILAALLCAIGIFGLTSFTVAKRAQEIGVRMTLGATRASIHWMVMREVSATAAIGCGLGLAAFLLVGRALSAMLFELTPSDPASLAAGAAALGGTAFLAGFLPAWRATLLDPARTLRQE